MTPSLYEKLSQMQQNLHTIAGTNGGQFVIMERGSRVIELVPPNRTESAFWTDLSAIDRGEWNAGGDRNWISPELEFFIDESANYEVPSQLDPGTYKLSNSPNAPSARTEQECTLRHTSGQIKILIRIEKEYTAIPNPFLMNPSASYANLLNVSYIGYTCESRLTVKPSEVTAQENFELGSVAASPTYYCNLWSLMQVPLDGIVLIPTRGNPQPLVMFKEQDAIEMEIHPHLVSLPFHGSHRFKLSFNSLQSTGRFGYIRRLNAEESSLIVRQFQINPSAYYPDYPFSDPNYKGSCMQFFCDGGQLGSFGELEYHTPAIPINDNSTYSDSSQLYYFIGKTEEIVEIAHQLL